MQLDCEIVTKQSKAGNPYTVLSIQLCTSPPAKKEVFLTDAEHALLLLEN